MKSAMKNLIMQRWQIGISGTTHREGCYYSDLDAGRAATAMTRQTGYSWTTYLYEELVDQMGNPLPPDARAQISS